ncbi:GNAT family N-acetyltransferase [Actinosynnema sp. CA-248983]
MKHALTCGDREIVVPRRHPVPHDRPPRSLVRGGPRPAAPAQRAGDDGPPRRAGVRRARGRPAPALPGAGFGHVPGGARRGGGGAAGFWPKEWQGAAVHEVGWSVVPEGQGRGVAAAAAVAVLEEVRAAGGPRWVHAFPSVENAASNAVCRKVGFTLIGEVSFEYPPGRFMRCNDWGLEL